MSGTNLANKPQPRIEMKLKKWFALLVALWAFLLYVNTVSNGYNLDDDLVTKGNPMVEKGIGGLFEIFSSPYDVSEERRTEYRPFGVAIFALEYELFGFNPMVSHFFNAVFYGVLCVFMFLFLLRLGGDGFLIPALGAVFLFAAHPLHTEVVASLKNREAIFSLSWGIGTCLSVLCYADKPRWQWLVIAVGCFLMGLISKVDVAVFVPVVALLLYYRGLPLLRVGIIAGVGVLCYLFFGVFKNSTLDLFTLPYKYFENPLFYPHTIDELLNASVVTSLWYLKKHFIPLPLCFYYGYDMVPIMNPPLWVLLFGWTLHVALVVAMGWGLWQKKLWALFGAMYFLCIGIFCQIVEPVTGIVADRHAFAAGMGFSAFVAWVLWHGIQRLCRSWATGLFIGVVVLVSLVAAWHTVQRNTEWQSPDTLLDADMPRLQKSAMANWMYGNNLMGRANNVSIADTATHHQLVLRAVMAYGKAVEVYPAYAFAWYNMGMAFMQVDSAFLSFRCFQKTLEVDSNFRSANFFVAQTFLAIGDTALSITHLEKECSTNINHKAAFLQLVELYKKNGLAQRAFDFGSWLLTKQPSIPEPYLFIANMYDLKGENTPAAGLRLKARKVSTNPKPEFSY